MNAKKTIEREFPNIILASYGKRLGAFLLDFLFIALVGLLSFKLTEFFYFGSSKGAAYNTFNYEVTRDTGLYLANDEHQDLILLTEDITLSNHETTYFSRLAYFYEQSKVTSALYPDLKDTKIFEYKKSFYYDQNKPFSFNEQVLELNSPTSSFTVDDDSNYIFKPLASSAFTSLEQYNNYKNETWMTLYNRAISDYEKSTAYQTARKPLVRFMQLNISLSIVVGTLIPLLAFPLLMKHGRSFGKYLLGLAVVTTDGYEVNTFKTLFRFVFLSFFELASNIFLFFVPLLLTTGAVTISKNSRALHDLFAGTFVIDAEQSKVFKDDSSERKYFTEKDTLKRDENSYFQMQKVQKKKSI